MKKVIFCGYGELGFQCLRELKKNKYDIKFIFTHKDVKNNEVEKFAIENKIEYTYDDSRKQKILYIEKLNQIEGEYLISVNYRYILEREIFEIQKYAVNIHGSLLPKYRGRTPNVWSIINGEKYSGVTVHLIDDGIDTGDIVKQIKIKIENSYTGFELLKKFEEVYPKIVIDSLEKLDRNEKLEKQNEEEASYFGRRTSMMGYIDFNKDSNEVINFVRSQSYPYPGAYYYIRDGRKIIINKIKVSEREKTMPIGIIKKDGGKYFVNCKNETLLLESYEL